MEVYKKNVGTEIGATTRRRGLRVVGEGFD
jgi:hypothetical protein